MGIAINSGQIYEMVKQPYSYAKYLYSGGSSSSGSTTPAPAAAPAQQAQPASPTAAASDLQVMLASIRPVQDGQVITAEDHNSLRLAMVAIANRLGIGVVSEEITVTIVPNLVAVTDGNAWLSEYGVATKPTNTTGAAKGWMEAELPDGARIKKIVAYGSIAGGGDDGKLKVRLVRQKVTDPTKSLVLAEATISPTTVMASGADADVTLPGMGLGVSAIEEARIIDNRENKYVLTAEIANLTGVTSAKLACFQIVCGMK
jgi:hypothetical protein